MHASKCPKSTHKGADTQSLNIKHANFERWAAIRETMDRPHGISHPAEAWPVARAAYRHLFVSKKSLRRKDTARKGKTVELFGYRRDYHDFRRNASPAASFTPQRNCYSVPPCAPSNPQSEAQCRQPLRIQSSVGTALISIFRACQINAFGERRQAIVSK
jgi:hypothetical protein